MCRRGSDAALDSTIFDEETYAKPTFLQRSNVAVMGTDASHVAATFGLVGAAKNPRIRDHDEMRAGVREKVQALNSQRRRMQSAGLALPKAGTLAVASIGKLATRLEAEDNHTFTSSGAASVVASVTAGVNVQSSDDAASAGSDLVTATSADGAKDIEAADAHSADTADDDAHDHKSRKQLIEDGTMLARLAEDPLQSVEALRPPRRPIGTCETVRTFSTGFMVENSVVNDSEPYQLFVETGRMVLAVHPLMIREEWLGSRLLMAFREHSRREASRLEEFYSEKYCAVLSAMIRLLDGRTNDAVRFQELLVEAKDYAEKAEAEEEAYLMRVEYLEELYKEIEACRRTQQFRATSIVLVMEMESDTKTDKREEMCSLARRLMEELQSIAASDTHLQTMSTRRAGDRTSSRRRNASARQEREGEARGRGGRGTVDDTNEAEGGKTEEEEEDNDDNSEEEYTGPAAILNEMPLTLSPGSRRKPVLARDASTDEATLPLEEVQRRRQIARTHIWTRLMINGRYAGKCSPMVLRRDFTVPLHFSFPVQVLNWPNSVVLQLWERRGPPLPASLLAEVPVPLPGVEDSSTYYPFVELHFTSTTPFAPSWAGTDREQAVFISGDVHVQCSWGAPRQYALEDKHEIEDGYRMPPRPDTARMGKLAISKMVHAPSQSREKEKEESLMSKMINRAHGVDGTVGSVSGFQMRQWMQGYGFDPNDPRNADLMELMRRNKDYFFALYNNEDIFRVPPYRLAVIEGIALDIGRQRSRRYELLKIRWEQELTNSVEVPLLESLMDETSISPKELKKSVKELKAGKDKKIHSTNAAFAAEKVVEERINAIEAFEQRVFDSVMDTIRRERGAAALPGNAGMPVSGVKRSGAVNSSLRSTDDIVKDVPIPKLLLDTKAISEFFAPRRGLKPRPASKTETTHPSKCFIHVNVLRGFNLPVRQGTAGTSGYNEGGDAGALEGRLGRRRPPQFARAAEGGDFIPPRLERTRSMIETERGLSMRSELTQSRDFMRQLNFEPEPENREAEKLSPFVEVKLQDAVARTRAVEGTHISFNEQLSLPFQPPNMDFSPSNLLYNDEELVINLFDEVVDEDERSSTDPRLAGNRNNRSVTRRFFLGSIRISTSSIYRMGCIQGKFRLDVPPVLIGFHKQPAGLPHLSLYISLEPNLAVPFPLTTPISIGTSENHIYERAMKWQSEVFEIGRCKNRSVQALVADSHGQICPVTKFVTPLEPPTSITEKRLGETLLTVIHRFVSLVPMIEDSVLQRQNKIWGTCAETIEMASGDYIEHALLLANYFLSAHVDAYVVLGTGIQQSEMCYVLTIDTDPNYDKFVRLWNPTSSSTFINHDTGCDLLNVGMVFNDRNMWANIQEKGEPWNMSFDLDDQRHWKPLFENVRMGRGMGNVSPVDPSGATTGTAAQGATEMSTGGLRPAAIETLGTIQKQPVYKELPREFYDDLEAQIEREALDAILEARLPLYTHQNTRCRRILRSLGKELEKAYLSIENAYQMTPQSQQAQPVAGMQRGPAMGGISSLPTTMASAISGIATTSMSAISGIANTSVSALSMGMLGSTSSSVAGPTPAQLQSMDPNVDSEIVNRLALLHNHHRKTLLPVSRTSKMAAFQLQTRFADADQIRAAVLNSGVHLDGTDTSEFVVSAHVDSSYNVAYVCAVWLYIAIIYK